MGDGMRRLEWFILDPFGSLEVKILTDTPGHVYVGEDRGGFCNISRLILLYH